MSALDFDTLRAINARRCEVGFKHSLEPGAPNGWSLLEWAGAMCGEAGEAANIAKKLSRLVKGLTHRPSEGDAERLRRAFLEELADVVIYCDLAATAAGGNLGEAVRLKFNSTSREIESEERL